MTEAAENRPDQPADHLAAATASDTLDAPLTDPTPHPWARYWAKMVDMGVFLVFALIVMSMLGWTGESMDIWAWILWITVFPLAEAVLIARFAGTPGKAVFGITVTDAQGGKLPLKASVLRSYGAMLFGSALSLPLLSFVANVFGWRAYRKTGLTRWDRRAKASVRARPTGKSWIVLCIIGLVLFVLAFMITAASMMQE